MTVQGLPYRAQTTLAKYGEGKNPETDEPDELVEDEFWFEADGTLVTDPARITELEAGITRLEALYGNSP